MKQIFYARKFWNNVPIYGVRYNWLKSQFIYSALPNGIKPLYRESSRNNGEIPEPFGSFSRAIELIL